LDGNWLVEVIYVDRRCWIIILYILIDSMSSEELDYDQ